MIKISLDFLYRIDMMKGDMNGTVTLDANESDYWYIDFNGPCGTRTFKDVITVIEPLNVNPGIRITQPFGLRGLKKAIALIEEERAKHGLTTLE